ncbi:hypothetical protein HZC09_06405 [Candidatus Micrarchaeota archaeon]|nr:hypothetical protein [Candidatus Micrarchaeota archaeon]MBI5229655.1 hypothetical protein [Candidatus Micrarchaeota archaeon]
MRLAMVVRKVGLNDLRMHPVVTSLSGAGFRLSDAREHGKQEERFHTLLVNHPDCMDERKLVAKANGVLKRLVNEKELVGSVGRLERF